MFYVILLLFLIVINFISRPEPCKDKKQRKTRIIVVLFCIVYFLIFILGFSPSAKITYKIKNITSDSKYVMDYATEDNKCIIVTAKTEDDGSKIYELTVLNKILWLYCADYKEYDRELIWDTLNYDFEMFGIKINESYYYFIDFDDSKISSLEVNG